MPVKFLKEVQENLWLGLWEIKEEENNLLQLSGKALLPDNFFDIKSEPQRKQTLAGISLVKELSERVYQNFEGIYKNEQEKPLLKNSQGHISISHSRHYAAATLHTQKPTGVDIEKVSPRLARIIPRICSQEEQANIKDDETATFYWCAKEAMYKLYGKEGLHFNKQLLVNIPDKNKGVIIDRDIKIDVQLDSMEVEDFMLVWASAN